MKIKPMYQCVLDMDWKVGDKVKVIRSSSGIYIVGKVYNIVEYGEILCMEGGWNGYNAELQLLPENSQFEFDF